MNGFEWVAVSFYRSFFLFPLTTNTVTDLVLYLVQISLQAGDHQSMRDDLLGGGLIGLGAHLRLLAGSSPGAPQERRNATLHRRAVPMGFQGMPQLPQEHYQGGLFG